MTGEKNLEELLLTMKPLLNKGNYVFCKAEASMEIPFNEIICFFREQEGNTLILKKEYADQLQLPYTFIASWITLTVHSSLEAVGLTAAFSSALSQQGISCNVVAAYYHDHIFVNNTDADKAMEVLQKFSMPK